MLSDEERRARAFAAFARNYQWHRVGVIDDGSIWGVSARSAFESAHGNIPGATVVTNANLPRSVCSILQDANWTAPEAEEVLDALVADARAAGTSASYDSSVARFVAVLQALEQLLPATAACNSPRYWSSSVHKDCSTGC